MAEQSVDQRRGRALGDRVIGWLFGYDAFISYSSDGGGKYASELATALQDKDFNCYFNGWASSFERALPPLVLANARRCSMLVIVGTANAAKSSNVAAEVNAFMSANAGRNRGLILLRLDDAIGLAPWASDLRSAVVVQGAPERPTDGVVAEIVLRAKFTRQARRLRRAAWSVIASVTLLGVIGSAWLWYALGAAEKARASEKQATSNAESAGRQAADALRAQNAAMAQTAIAKSEAQKATTELGAAQTNLAGTRDDLRRANQEKEKINQEKRLTEAAVESLRQSTAADPLFELNPDAALASAAAAVRRSPAPETVAKLRQILQNHMPHQAFPGYYTDGALCATGDGSLVYSEGSQDAGYPLVEWDIRGRSKRTLRCGSEPLSRLACSPLARAAVARFGDHVLILGTNNARVVQDEWLHDSSELKFAPDGSGFAVWGRDSSGPLVASWTAAGARIGRRTLQNQWGQVDLLPGARGLVALDERGTVRRIDLGSSAIAASEEISKLKERKISMSDGKLLIDGQTKDNFLRCEVWDVDSLRPLQRDIVCNDIQLKARGLRSEERAIVSDYEPMWTGTYGYRFYAGPSANRLFIADRSTAIDWWDIDLSLPQHSLAQSLARTVKQTCTNGAFLTASDQSQDLWSPAMPDEVRPLPRYLAEAALARDASKALITRWVFDRDTQTSEVLLASGNDLTAVWTGSSGGVPYMGASPSGQFFAFVGAGEVHRLDTMSKQVVSIGSTNAAPCLAVSDIGEIAWSGGEMVWNMPGRDQYEFSEDGCPQAFLADALFITREGRWVAQGVRALREGERDIAAPSPLPFEGDFGSATRDGLRFVTGDRLGTIRVYDRRSQSAPFTLTRRLETSLSASSGSTIIPSEQRTFALLSLDSGLYVWDIEHGGLAWALRRNGPISGARFRAAAFAGPSKIAFISKQELRVQDCIGCRAVPDLLKLADERQRQPKDLGVVDLCAP